MEKKSFALCVICGKVIKTEKNKSYLFPILRTYREGIICAMCLGMHIPEEKKDDFQEFNANQFEFVKDTLILKPREDFSLKAMLLDEIQYLCAISTNKATYTTLNLIAKWKW